MSLTKNICPKCKGTGGEVDKHGPPTNEFGNTPDWIPCNECDGSGLARKVLNSIGEALLEQQLMNEMQQRDGRLEGGVNEILTMIEDRGTGGESNDEILGIVIGALEELQCEFWPEPPDEGS